MIPVIETTKHRKAPVATIYRPILGDRDAVRARIQHLVTLADAYLENGASSLAGEKLLEAGLLARAHAKVETRNFARACAKAMEDTHGED